MSEISADGMRIGIVGAGRIGGNIATQLAKRGHEVLLSFSRDEEALSRLRDEIGERARVGSPREAAEFGDAVVLAVPWGAVDAALAETGSLDDRVVIDTTNQMGAGGWEDLDRPAVVLNAERMPGARIAKAFNTITVGYQQSVGNGEVDGEIAMFFAAEDDRAREVVQRLISDCGFSPVDLGGWAQVSLMEAPRREGAVYGEAYRPDDAAKIAAAAREDLEKASRLAIELRLQA